MSGIEKEVLRMGKQLDKMVAGGEDGDHSQALDLLQSLKEKSITLEVLQKTRIGMSVNNLRKKTSNDDVTSLAKSLIKGWKKLLPMDAAKEQAAKEDVESKKLKLEEDTKREETNGRAANSSSYAGEDMVRSKCREMIATALKTAVDESTFPDLDKTSLQDPDELSIEIEDCIYTEFVRTDMKYKNRVRSRVSNLQDQKNPFLRIAVLKRDIPPERIAKMGSDEMASQEMKDMRSAFTKEGINEHQMAMTGGTKSSLFKCFKCFKKNCTYSQVQTRSADEPMTTFVYCNECGNRWKFC